MIVKTNRLMTEAPAPSYHPQMMNYGYQYNPQYTMNVSQISCYVFWQSAVPNELNIKLILDTLTFN